MQATIRKPTSADLGLLILLAMMWASSFLVIKIAVVDTGPLWLATIRVVVAFMVLLPFAMYKGFIWPNTLREWRLVLLVAALNVVIPFFLISWAETKIDAGMASMLMGVGPFMALLGSHLTTQDDRLSRNKLIGAILGFSGILVLVGWSSVKGLGDNLLGQGAAILGAACYVTSGLLIRRLNRFPPIQLSAFILGLASVSLLFVTGLMVGMPVVSFARDTWIGLLYLGIFPTALGYILRYHLIQTIGMSAFATGLNLIPVFGVVLGVIFLGEHLSLNVLVSLALIVAGLFIIRRG
ncbi:EamA family transporter [Cocleimonas flava]|uniref:Threonine/homoserine efflux transporter RhtA n=1 Tax=Cocleimonas flava TaxID=634765 RepID=A0A4R1ESY2_9GAMM|nr:DMT family transporter [Cocleimonas flava]TCJ83032.1 threonine/homoserine efflux transporter RhtA [Cocleimonas flava]